MEFPFRERAFLGVVLRLKFLMRYSLEVPAVVQEGGGVRRGCIGVFHKVSDLSQKLVLESVLPDCFALIHFPRFCLRVVFLLYLQ